MCLPESKDCPALERKHTPISSSSFTDWLCLLALCPSGIYFSIGFKMGLNAILPPHGFRANYFSNAYSLFCYWYSFRTMESPYVRFPNIHGTVMTCYHGPVCWALCHTVLITRALTSNSQADGNTILSHFLALKAFLRDLLPFFPSRGILAHLSPKIIVFRFLCCEFF